MLVPVVWAGFLAVAQRTRGASYRVPIPPAGFLLNGDSELSLNRSVNALLKSEEESRLPFPPFILANCLLFLIVGIAELRPVFLSGERGGGAGHTVPSSCPSVITTGLLLAIHLCPVLHAENTVLDVCQHNYTQLYP